jgi:FixJ family two-component response regulator
MAAEHPLIAVLDDEESIRRALQRLLRSAGFDVQTFASGAEFLESLGTRRPGCLVLDIHMRGMTGFDVLAALESLPLRVPTLVITAFDDETAEARALQAGALRFMRKPIREDDLLDAVAAALRSNSNSPPVL